MKRNITFFFCCIIFLLTGCDFHLRGPVVLAPPLKRLYIQSDEPYGKLVHVIRQYLKMSGVTLVENSKQATAILILGKENQGQQLVSVSGSQQTRQYNLILSTTFQVNHPQGTVWIPQQTVSENRTITIQSNQVLAGSNEANVFYQVMRQTLGYNLMNQLSSAGVTQILAHPQPPTQP